MVPYPFVGARAGYSARPTVIFPATECNFPLDGTEIYRLLTEAHRCKKLAQGHYAVLPSQDSNTRPVNSSNFLYGVISAKIIYKFNTDSSFAFTGSKKEEMQTMLSHQRRLAVIVSSTNSYVTTHKLNL